MMIVLVLSPPVLTVAKYSVLTGRVDTTIICDLFPPNIQKIHKSAEMGIIFVAESRVARF